MLDSEKQVGPALLPEEVVKQVRLVWVELAVMLDSEKQVGPALLPEEVVRLAARLLSDVEERMEDFAMLNEPPYFLLSGG